MLTEVYTLKLKRMKFYQTKTNCGGIRNIGNEHSLQL